eukprot:2872739-Amphidinium_carterae.2
MAAIVAPSEESVIPRERILPGRADSWGHKNRRRKMSFDAEQTLLHVFLLPVEGIQGVAEGALQLATAYQSMLRNATESERFLIACCVWDGVGESHSGH